MCGRFTLTATSSEIADWLGWGDPPEWNPRFNIAPTQQVLCVRPGGPGESEVVSMRWGLVPSWARDVSLGSRMINARSETVAEKPAFRAAFKRRRCLVLADGFYEWKKTDSGKQPFHIRVQEGLYAMAGLWEHWQPPRGDSGQPLETCTILTTRANHALVDLHDRMPVILDRTDHDRWLDPNEIRSERLLSLCQPCPDEWIRFWPVSTMVNRPTHDQPDCVKPLE